MTVNGFLLAKGGGGYGVYGVYIANRFGLPGSGGSIRIVATTIAGDGYIKAYPGGGVRLETENFNFLLYPENGIGAGHPIIPEPSIGPPGLLFLPELPVLRISNVGSVTVPAATADFHGIALPGVTTNPVNVSFSTSNVPAGSTIELTATPRQNEAVVVISGPVAADGSATASINLPNGSSSLTAEIIFDLEGSTETGAIGIGETYAPYAGGEAVQRVRLNVDASGQSTTTLTTVSGRTYTVPANPVAMH